MYLAAPRPAGCTFHSLHGVDSSGGNNAIVVGGGGVVVAGTMCLLTASFIYSFSTGVVFVVERYASH